MKTTTTNKVLTAKEIKDFVKNCGFSGRYSKLCAKTEDFVIFYTKEKLNEVVTLFPLRYGHIQNFNYSKYFNCIEITFVIDSKDFENVRRYNERNSNK